MRNAKTNLSCGCIRNDGFKVDLEKDLTGIRFGLLTVLSKIDDKKDLWNCLCDCGNTKIFSRLQLVRGRNKSCGCNSASNSFKDLTGQKFGRLNVLYRDKNDKTGHVKWVCECDCGNIVSVYKDALLNGKQVSCGCYKLDVHKSEEYRLSRRSLNDYDLSGDYGIGYCSNTGKPFYFDKEDYELIKNYTWRDNCKGYVVASIDRNGDSPTMLIMHRLILGLTSDDSVEIDHIGHNTYDNRKAFLRIATHSQNRSNHVIAKSNKSGVSGVCWDTREAKWVAYIGKENDKIRLGYFSDFNDAVAVRKSAEEKYFGEYSYDNSIELYNTQNPIIENDFK